MLVLNRSLLNREYILMNVLKALASIISMCNLHVILVIVIVFNKCILVTDLYNNKTQNNSFCGMIEFLFYNSFTFFGCFIAKAHNFD
jgi:uncharacterized membrane protein (DUF485 family)